MNHYHTTVIVAALAMSTCLTGAVAAGPAVAAAPAPRVMPWDLATLSQLPCRVSNDEVIASKPLPAATTSFIITAFDPRDCLMNSDLVETPPPKP